MAPRPADRREYQQQAWYAMIEGRWEDMRYWQHMVALTYAQPHHAPQR